MGIDIRHPAIDIGIVIRESEPSLRFYRDTLGFAQNLDMAIPGGTMHRLVWGGALLKLIRWDKPLSDSNPPGGMRKATGIRYITISVDDLAAMVDRCTEAGYRVAIPTTEIRPGITIAMIEDPEGNWVELLATS